MKLAQADLQEGHGNSTKSETWSFQLHTSTV